MECPAHTNIYNQLMPLFRFVKCYLRPFNKYPPNLNIWYTFKSLIVYKIIVTRLMVKEVDYKRR